jgi:hypothetical protein
MSPSVKHDVVNRQNIVVSDHHLGEEEQESSKKFNTLADFVIYNTIPNSFPSSVWVSSHVNLDQTAHCNTNILLPRNRTSINIPFVSKVKTAEVCINVSKLTSIMFTCF